MMTLQERDGRTGRPLDAGGEALSTLSDPELEREMTIAALSSARSSRYERLLAERERRRSRRPR